jgi:hypothetical protein
MPYFPRPSASPDIPEEVFFSILEYLHPGATWLFCRQVSKSWKVHVDCNIERYINHYNCLLASERAKVEELCQSGERTDHLVQRLQADSIYVEVRWNQFPGDVEEKSSSLVLRFKEVELPLDNGVRDLDKWDERVTFMAEENLSIYGHALSILRIEHFMFPGFSPAAPDHTTMSDPFRVGTHCVNFGQYNVEYSLSPIDVGFSALSIHSITVPVRSLMTFSTPHVVGTEMVLSGSLCRLRYTSPLFNTIVDERQFLPENILAERKRDEYQRWKTSMKPLCEMCFMNPLDRWCQMFGCEVCCSRMGSCVGHLIGPRGLQQRKQKALEFEALPEIVTPGMELASWGVGEGQENWGKYLTISNFSENETLVELDEAWPDYHALPSASILPASRDERPKSASGIPEIRLPSDVGYTLRRVSSFP